jgi:hypothetical protein
MTKKIIQSLSRCLASTVLARWDAFPQQGQMQGQYQITQLNKKFQEKHKFCNCKTEVSQ